MRLPKKHRLNIELSPATMKQIRSIGKRMDTTSIVEVIRRSIAWVDVWMGDNNKPL